jgi:uncharacterized membrane protein (UPF0127 family)
VGKGNNQRTLKTMNVCINIRYFRMYDLLMLFLNDLNTTVQTQASLRPNSDGIIQKLSHERKALDMKRSENFEDHICVLST